MDINELDELYWNYNEYITTKMSNERAMVE